MSKCILDSSALLALFNLEKGHEMVEKLLPHSIMSTVNVAEVISELEDRLDIKSSSSKEVVYKAINQIISFDFEQATKVGSLKKFTKPFGLSLGDRACIALGIMLNVPIYTSDKAWSKLNLSCEIVQIR